MIFYGRGHPEIIYSSLPYQTQLSASNDLKQSYIGGISLFKAIMMMFIKLNPARLVYVSSWWDNIGWYLQNWLVQWDQKETRIILQSVLSTKTTKLYFWNISGDDVVIITPQLTMPPRNPAVTHYAMFTWSKLHQYMSDRGRPGFLYDKCVNIALWCIRRKI